MATVTVFVTYVHIPVYVTVIVHIKSYGIGLMKCYVR